MNLISRGDRPNKGAGTSGLTIDEAFAIEDVIAGEVMFSKDAREGPRAYVEKREPNYIGA